MISEIISQILPADDLPVIYASTFSETKTLENFIDSFPHPSPLKFQLSIHPSAVQQAFIACQRPLPYLLPITCGSGISIQALSKTMLQAGAAVLLAGEEPCTWLYPSAFYAYVYALHSSISCCSRTTPLPVSLDDLPSITYTCLFAQRFKNIRSVCAVSNAHL